MLKAEVFTEDSVACSVESRVRTLCELGPRNTTKQLWNALGHLRSEFEQLDTIPNLQLVPTMEHGTKVARYNAVYRYGSRRARNVVVLGAHYDTVPGTVGADDNASGVAAVLGLLELFRFYQPRLVPGYAVEFVLFVNEEPPRFSSEEMGSFHYFRKSLPARKGIPALFVNLDCLGYQADAERRAWYIIDPKDETSRRIFSRWEGAAPAVPHDHGITGYGSFSDLRWVIGKSPGVHLCDMAITGNPHMHRQTDTPDTLDYRWMAQIILGLYDVLMKEYQSE